MADTSYMDATGDDAISSEVVAVVDPAVSPSLGTGYIKIDISFSNPGAAFENVSNDVISVSTDQGTSEQEGDATAKMTVTLHNPNNRYANHFIPQATLVQSTIEIERNIVSGNKINVTREKYPLFYGRVQEITMDNEICTVECGDETSAMEASLDFEYTYDPEQSIKDRVQSMLDAMDPKTNLQVHGPYFGKSLELQLEWMATTEDYAKSNISSVCKSMGVDWEVPSDQIDRLIIMDHSGYRVGTSDPDLTDLILPSDNESIVGHCNNVTVNYGNNVNPTSYAKNIQTSTNREVTYQNSDEESVQKYGNLESKKFEMPWINTEEQAKAFVDNVLELYKSYEDRLITPTVIDYIPMLNSWMHYTIHGYSSMSYEGTEEPKDFLIETKVLRKRVTYDTNGVVSQLECLRRSAEVTPGSEVPNDHERKGTPIGSEDPDNPDQYNEYILWDLFPDGSVGRYIGATKEQYDEFMRGIYPDVDWEHGFTSDGSSSNPHSPWGPVVNGYLV